MKTRKMFRWICTALAAVLLLSILCIPAFAEGNNDVFVQTTKVGSNKMIKNDVVYDMYTYFGEQAVLQKDADGTLWIPIRVVSELAGLDVLWNEENRTVKLTDPDTGDYWIVGIGWDFAKKYSAAGVLQTERWMYKVAQLRRGASYLTIQDIAAIYGFQVYDRDYEGDTYVIMTNQALTMSYAEITALCYSAAALI